MSREAVFHPRVLTPDEDDAMTRSMERILEADRLLIKTSQPPESDPSGKAASEPGAKLDAGKTMPSLILSAMPRAVMAVAEVGTFGAVKYSRDGWLSVKDGVVRYTDAMDRHRLYETIDGPIDPQSKLRHAAHLAWNAMARLELMLREAEALNNHTEK